MFTYTPYLSWDNFHHVFNLLLILFMAISQESPHKTHKKVSLLTLTPKDAPGLQSWSESKHSTCSAGLSTEKTHRCMEGAQHFKRLRRERAKPL